MSRGQRLCRNSMALSAVRKGPHCKLFAMHLVLLIWAAASESKSKANSCSQRGVNLSNLPTYPIEKEYERIQEWSQPVLFLSLLRHCQASFELGAYCAEFPNWYSTLLYYLHRPGSRLIIFRYSISFLKKPSSSFLLGGTFDRHRITWAIWFFLAQSWRAWHIWSRKSRGCSGTKDVDANLQLDIDSEERFSAKVSRIWSESEWKFELQATVGLVECTSAGIFCKSTLRPGIWIGEETWGN